MKENTTTPNLSEQPIAIIVKNHLIQEERIKDFVRINADQNFTMIESLKLKNANYVESNLKLLTIQDCIVARNTLRKLRTKGGEYCDFKLI